MAGVLYSLVDVPSLHTFTGAPPFELWRNDLTASSLGLTGLIACSSRPYYHPVSGGEPGMSVNLRPDRPVSGGVPGGSDTSEEGGSELAEGLLQDAWMETTAEDSNDGDGDSQGSGSEDDDDDDEEEEDYEEEGNFDGGLGGAFGGEGPEQGGGAEGDSSEDDDEVLMRFSGHRNRQTVKGISFLGAWLFLSCL